MPQPAEPKIYHIVHVDRLASIVADGGLWSDAFLQARARPGTTIGMGTIKQRRLTTPVECRPGLNVGDCVPFYFCTRSVMLYKIHMANDPELVYRGGQGPIVHLEGDLHDTVDWAEQQERQWAFTLSNAGSSYFEDRCDLVQLDEIDCGMLFRHEIGRVGRTENRQSFWSSNHSPGRWSSASEYAPRKFGSRRATP